MKKFFIISFLLSLSCISFATNFELCNSNNKVGDTCYLMMSDAHPSQSNIGEYQVQKKNLPEYQEIAKEAYSSGKSIVKALEKDQLDSLLPVVRDQNDEYYIVDHHHHLRGLYEFYKTNSYGLESDPSKIKVYVMIQDDYSNEKDEASFWKKMQDNNYFWPYTFSPNGYLEYSYKDLPETIAGMGDDPYRSAMGLAQKQGDFKKPKGNEVFFYQFKWGKCVEQLGFMDPVDMMTINPEKVITDSIEFLSNNAEQMKQRCIGDGYENMPIPTKK